MGSYLIEITAKILSRRDESGPGYLLDMIQDQASQKGTGGWTSQEGLNLGTAVPAITTAVELRNLSSRQGERLAIKKAYPLEPNALEGDKKEVIEMSKNALWAATLIVWAQGFSLLQEASMEYGFDLDLARIARVWRGGCIIRASVLDDIADIFEEKSNTPNLLASARFNDKIRSAEKQLRSIAATFLTSSLPGQAHAASLGYLDTMRTPTLSTNLIQAQRDFFGAHTYHRLIGKVYFTPTGQTRILHNLLKLLNLNKEVQGEHFSSKKGLPEIF